MRTCYKEVEFKDILDDLKEYTISWDHKRGVYWYEIAKDDKLICQIDAGYSLKQVQAELKRYIDEDPSPYTKEFPCIEVNTCNGEVTEEFLTLINKILSFK